MSGEFEGLPDRVAATPTLPSEKGNHWSAAARAVYGKPDNTTSDTTPSVDDVSLMRTRGASAEVPPVSGKTDDDALATIQKQLTIRDDKKSFVEDYPVATGVAVTALAGTALLLSRGRIANALVPRSQNVLVVEAAPFMGKAFKHSLEEAGHRVTWVTEIDSLRPLVGMTDEGAQVALKMNRFHTAFIDPNHVTKAAIDFDKLAPFFRSGNVRTIGTSVMRETNEKMLAKGVDVASDKTTVLMSLVGKRLDLQQVVRSPEKAQRSLTDLKNSLNSDELLGLRKQTEELVKAFLAK